MRANRSFEIGTGLFVLLGFAALLFLTTQLPNSGLKLNVTQAGYHVTAQFDNVGDLKSGSPVTMDGVHVGEVEDIHIDWHNYRAQVTMRIDPQFTQIPDDSDASIATQGLLGGKYVAIGPGGSDTYLKNGSQIQFTQSAIVLENLVNKLFANFAGGKGSDSGSGSSGGEGAKGQASGAGKSGPGGDAAGSGSGTGHAADQAPGNATAHRPAASNGH
jgi:phospholipid/cholesterol/gamma-HCH transport system substrate-binding protein